MLQTLSHLMLRNTKKLHRSNLYSSASFAKIYQNYSDLEHIFMKLYLSVTQFPFNFFNSSSFQKHKYFPRYGDSKLSSKKTY